ncbi:MAG TPA: hypothetical protein VKM93_23310 [Terriglobia bacterium]|nr:hypothetical protein [Terriglobia bacterium]
MISNLLPGEKVPRYEADEGSLESKSRLSDGDARHMRALVFITELTQKGTERSGQEYQSPLLILSGEEYDKITFADFCEGICSVLRGNRAPATAQSGWVKRNHSPPTKTCAMTLVIRFG